MVFESLRDALNGTKGNTRKAVALVSENLYIGESVSFVATCSVNDFGRWSDASIMLSNQRLFVSYTLESTGQTLALTTSIPSVPAFNELQSKTTLRVFVVPGVSVQAVAMTSEQYVALNQALERLAGHEISLEPAQPRDDAVESLSTLKQLLDRGLVTQEEYDAKKEEVLGRL